MTFYESDRDPVVELSDGTVWLYGGGAFHETDRSLLDRPSTHLQIGGWDWIKPEAKAWLAEQE